MDLVKCLDMTQTPLTEQTKTILTHFFHIFSYASTTIRNKLLNQKYEVIAHHLTQGQRLPAPPRLGINTIPAQVKQFMHNNLHSYITFKTQLDNLPVQIIFVIHQQRITDKIIDEHFVHFQNILIWLTVILHYAIKRQTQTLNIYIYMTPLIKKIPTNHREIIGPNNVNTAYTGPNAVVGEIVIYRKEEWFKVFIHETMHTFGVDFSDMNDDVCTTQIIKLFNVDTSVNLSEAYTEFWGRMMNAIFESFKKYSNSIPLFLTDVHTRITYESAFSIIQMVKVLKHMGLTYTQIVSKSHQPSYKEATSVLSYYIICGLLLVNYQKTLKWCATNNKNNIIQFTKTQTNQIKFCKYIEQQYLSPPIQKLIKKAETDGIHCVNKTSLRMTTS